MRRALLSIGPLILGLCLLVAGFLYDLQFAGLPYQDPTPELQAQYNFHSSVASRIMSAGAVLMLAGLVWLVCRLIGSAWRRRSSRT